MKLLGWPETKYTFQHDPFSFLERNLREKGFTQWQTSGATKPTNTLSKWKKTVSSAMTCQIPPATLVAALSVSLSLSLSFSP